MSIAALTAACAKAPPLPEIPYETHGFKRKQKEMLDEVLKPMPPKYPYLC